MKNLTKSELRLARRRYNDQKSACRSRVDINGNPIRMLLTFDEWLTIWLQSGHYHERGRKIGQYCMSRKNDVGHYEVNNVVIKQFNNNVAEARTGKPQTALQRQNLLKAITGVPKSQEHRRKISEFRSIPIQTPEGQFNSILAASKHYNKHTKWVQDQLKKNPTQFYRLK